LALAIDAAAEAEAPKLVVCQLSRKEIIDLRAKKLNIGVDGLVKLRFDGRLQQNTPNLYREYYVSALSSNALGYRVYQKFRFQFVTMVGYHD